jgi:hypothetical protein
MAQYYKVYVNADATDYTASQGHIIRPINKPSYWNQYIKQKFGRPSLQEPIN